MTPCVLVIDDNADIRRILSIQLTRAGLDVMTAADGQAGLDILQHRSPCCVLLDLMMPGMNGFEFLDSLRRHHAAPPPVFVVTQNDDSWTGERVRRLGAARLVPKGQAMRKSFACTLAGLLETTAAINRGVPKRPAATAAAAA